MKETFVVNQNLKLKEFLSAVYYISLKSKLIRRIILLAIIFSCAGILIDIIAEKDFTLNTIFSNLFLPFFLIIFFSIVIAIGAILLMILKPGNFKNITYTFTHWGMEKIGRGIDFTRSWNKFLKYKETKHFIFLFITENDAHIIQKRNVR
jgi:hypothetical protein